MLMAANKETLETVEKAIFLVVLESTTPKVGRLIVLFIESVAINQINLNIWLNR